MEEVKKTGLTFIDTRRLANMSYKDIKNGFVGFGYYLKIIHDEKLWQGNGYNSFNQFLDAEYGKDKSWASRCINLYDKFGVPVEPGELPRLEEQYEAYNVSQLIEMLPMEEELREQVTPDMKIPAIRAMKPKKEKKVATVATPEPAPPEPETQPEPEVLHFTAGDRTIDNAYGATIAAVVRVYLDSEYAGPARESEVTAFGLVYKVLKRQDITVFYTETGRTVFDIENARLEEEYQYWHGTKAEPAPAKPTRSEAEQDSCPPGITDCQRQEWGTGPAEQEAGKKECKACWASWKRQHKALGAGTVEQEPEEPQEPLSAYGTPKRVYPEDSLIAIAGCEGGHSCTSCHVECGIRQEDCYCVDAPMGNPFPCDTLKTIQTLRDEIGSKCQFVDHSLAYHRVGDHEPVPCCRECGEPCEYICGRAKKQLEAKANIPQNPNSPGNVIDGEFTEIQEPEKDIQEPEESLTELQIAQDELERAKRLLEKGLECGVDENDIHIRRLKTAVCAWASYVCDLDSIVNPPPKPVQPELPPLKNNDQRKAWLRDYKSWGLWYRDENIGVSYYKYDFDNGARLIVEEYQEFSTYTGDYTSFFLHLVGGPKPPMHPSYGYEKWTHSEKYSRTINSDSELFGFLKALQQKKG